MKPEENEPEAATLCRLCEEFNGAYRCASPLECDCPKCSGLCRCELDENKPDEPQREGATQ